MAEEITDLKIMGLSLVFEVGDNSDRHLATGTIPVSPDAIDEFKDTKLYKFICEKCNVGEMIFTPNAEDTIYTFTHMCPNCNNTEVFNQIYPSVAIVDGETLNDIESFDISFKPIFKAKETIN